MSLKQRQRLIASPSDSPLFPQPQIGPPSFFIRATTEQILFVDAQCRSRAPIWSARASV